LIRQPRSLVIETTPRIKVAVKRDSVRVLKDIGRIDNLLLASGFNEANA